MKKYYLNSLVIAFFLLLPIIPLYHWFSDGTMIYFWDQLFPFDPKNNILDFYYLWKASVFPGSFDPGWSWLQYLLHIYVFDLVFQSPATSQAVLYWLLLVSSLINFYLLSKKLISNISIARYYSEIISILGAILYTFNTYVFYYSFRIFNPQEYIIAFLPLNILCLMYLFPLKKSVSHRLNIVLIFLFFVSLILMVPGFSSLIFFIEYLIVIFLYLCFYIVVNNFQIKKVLSAIFFYILIVLFNIWWLYPMLIALSSVFALSSQIGTTVYFALNSQLNNLLNVTRLIGFPPMQQPIFSWESIYRGEAFSTLVLFVFPALIFFLSLKFKDIKEKPLILFLFTIFILFIFIAKEGNPPFSFIMEYGFNNIPFFGVFRDAYHKAGIYYVFSYFTLVVYALTYYLSQWKARIPKFALLGIFTLATVLMVAPFFFFQNIPTLFLTSENNPAKTLTAKTKIPQEYYQLKGPLENECQGSPVLVVPKTAILSSGYWPNTGYNYVGQDILHSLIDCKFIVTQTSNAAADAYYSVPYLNLQNSEVEEFKKFLEISQTKLILVRKDYVSNQYTDGIPLNVGKVENLLSSDNTFQKTYENKYFIVYSTQDNQENYGFSFSPNIVTSNVDFANGSQIYETFKVLDSSDAQIFSLDTLTSNNISLPSKDLIFGACIGCEYLPNSPKAEVDDKATLEKDLIDNVKTHIKNITGKRNAQTLDEKLALMEEEFLILLEQIENNEITPDINSSIYVQTLNNIKAMVEDSNADEFQKNYDLIKFRNYVALEFDKINAFIESNPENISALNVSYLQQSVINHLNNNIWETDFNNQIFRYRLNVVNAGEYACQATSASDAINITGFNYDDRQIYKGLSDNVLENKSYKVNVNYDSEIVYSSKLIFDNEKFSIKKMKIDDLTPNSLYKFSIKPNTSASGYLAIVVTTVNIDESEPGKIINLENESALYQVRKPVTRFMNGFEEYFFTVGDPEKSHYVYLIREPNVGDNSLYEVDFSLNPIPTVNTISFSCKEKHVPNLLKPKYTVVNTTHNIFEINVDDFATDSATDSARLLSFNQSFNKYWEASTIINGEKHVFTHIPVNGHANAWYIDKVGNDKIYVTFVGQELSEKAALISVSLFIVLLCGYIYFRKKR